MPDDSYVDIINLPHHTSPTRPRMKMVNRAAQFSPFAALTGYGDAIDEAARLTEEKYDLSEEERLALSEKLRILKAALADRPELTITHFQPDKKKSGGAYISTTGIVKRVRELERELVLEDGKVIEFDNILEMEGELFDRYS